MREGERRNKGMGEKGVEDRERRKEGELSEMWKGEGRKKEEERRKGRKDRTGEA